MSLKEKKTLEKILGKHVTLLDMVLLVLFAVALSWLADGIMEFVSVDYKGLSMLVCALIILAYLYFRYKELLSRYVKDDATIIEKIDARPVKALVITLSKNYKLELTKKIRSFEDTTVGQKNYDKHLTQWQMPFEAINFHKDKLETLIVIVSEESKDQYSDFAEVMHKCFGSKINMSKVEMNIHDLDMIKIGYHKAMNYLDRYTNNEIVFDITSGNSLSTLAGGLFTLDYNRMVQYIDTSNYELTMYDNKIVE